MGSGIAEVCAKAGVEVTVVELTPEALSQGETRIHASFDRAESRGKIDASGRSVAMSRLNFTTNVNEIRGCQIVFEAVAELKQVKLELFETLDLVIGSDPVILASNTSSIPIAELAMATTRPERVIGVHFFNPVPVLPLVEITSSLLTAPDILEVIENFLVNRLSRQVIKSRDQAGFVVNALLIPFLLSAIRMYESGSASADDIDKGMELGCAHPMGPLRLADFIGLDTVTAIAEVLFNEYKAVAYAPPPMLSRMVSSGLLGRKSGKGFYDY